MQYATPLIANLPENILYPNKYRIFMFFFPNLQPSMDVFKSMLHDLEIGRDNSDGADQGFLVGCYPDLLDKPLFHPPENGTKLNGTYRLPLGYQMDASYYCEHCCYLAPVSELHMLFVLQKIFTPIYPKYCRSQASLACSMRAKQRDHIP
jgi:hypothetical protein